MQQLLVWCRPTAVSCALLTYVPLVNAFLQEAGETDLELWFGAEVQPELLPSYGILGNHLIFLSVSILIERLEIQIPILQWWLESCGIQYMEMGYNF